MRHSSRGLTPLHVMGCLGLIVVFVGSVMLADWLVRGPLSYRLYFAPEWVSDAIYLLLPAAAIGIVFHLVNITESDPRWLNRPFGRDRDEL